MEFISEIAMFILKSTTITIAALIVLVGTIVGVIGYTKKSKKTKSPVKFTRIGKDEASNLDAFLESKLGVAESQESAKEKIKKMASESRDKMFNKTTFLINFKGDVEAKSETNFRNEINAVISVGKEGDELIVNLKTGGGYVHSYGMASELLKRVKKKGITLTVTVDEIAASGGYMMASVADKIYAAPFSIIGSVGVVSEFPNFNGLLEKNGIDYKQYTAGEYKRTVSPMGKITEDAEKKFKEDLEKTHELFKAHIKAHRPDVDVEKISTGETWYGQVAIENNLVDEISITEDVVERKMEDSNVIIVQQKQKKELKEAISDVFSATAVKAFTGITTKLGENKHAKI